jgi:hypothetical protein
VECKDWFVILVVEERGRSPSPVPDDLFRPRANAKVAQAAGTMGDIFHFVDLLLAQKYLDKICAIWRGAHRTFICHRHSYVMEAEIVFLMDTGESSSS